MKRRILFSLGTFIIILSVSTAIIFWAQGNRIDFKKNIIETTGVLYIQSTPSNALVELNGKIKGYTPTSVDSLMPGKYTVRISKNSLTSWEGSVYIDPGKITSIYPILLNTTDPINKLNSTQSVIQATFSPYYNMSVYEVNNNNQLSLWVNNYNNSFINSGTTETSILTPSAPLLSLYKVDLTKSIFSPDNQKILLYTEDNAGIKHYFILDTNSNNTTPLEVNTLLDPNLYDAVTWGTDANHLLFQGKGILVSLDVNTGQKYILFQGTDNTDPLYTMLSNTIYIPTFHNQQASLITEQLNGNSQNVIDLPVNTPIKSIITNDIDTIALSTKDTTYTYTIGTKAFLPIYHNATDLVAFSPSGNDILFTSEGFVHVYIKAGNTTEDLNLSVSDYKDIMWHPLSSEIFYTTINKDNSYNLMAIVPTENKPKLVYANISSPQIGILSQGQSIEAQIKDAVYLINIVPNNTLFF